MSKRKHARTAKKRTASKVRAKAARRQTGNEHHASVRRSTGWQPHTVRGCLAAVVRKKLGLRLESEKTGGERVYRIIAGSPSDSASEPGA